jgi:hypothetical protein
LDYGERNPNDWGAGSALFDAKGSFFDEIGIFWSENAKKPGLGPMNPLSSRAPAVATAVSGL